MELARLKELVQYLPNTGEIFLKKSQRLLTPDEYGFIVVYDGQNKRRTKIRADRIAWELGNDKTLPEGYKILHKNLNEMDNRLYNLCILSRVVYKNVQEAIRNLEGHLKLLPHPDDQYSYVLHYQEHGVDKKEVKHDIVAAKQRYMTIQLACAKLLNKYCIFD